MRIVLYYEDQEQDITPYTVEVNYSHTLSEPYGSASIRLNVPLPSLFLDLPTYDTSAFNLNLWCCVYDFLEGESEYRGVFLGVLSSISTSLNVSSEGFYKSDNTLMRFEPWMHPLRVNQIFLSAQSPLFGHFLDIESFGARFKSLASVPFKTRQVGVVLASFLEELANIYSLPSRLSDSAFNEIVNVVYTKETASNHAPKREHTIREVFGLALNAVKGSTSIGSSAWATIKSIFDPDSNLIELFCSLEPTDNPQTPLEKKLRSKLCLIYRFKPFAFGEVDSQRDLTDVIESIEKAEDIAIHLDPHLVRGMDFNQNDQDRVNGVFINTPLTPSRGVDVFELSGDPVFDEIDIEQTGLRLYRGYYPFFPQGKRKTKKTYKQEVQYIVDLSALIVGEAHKYFDGTIYCHQVNNIQAGEWVSVVFNKELDTKLICYVESISHAIRAEEDGRLDRSTTISYTRGFIK
jgi:hypothetical protein